jgi:hypothetical protein
VGRLAAGIYAERDFTPARMGVLADAAEEAGVPGAGVVDASLPADLPTNDGAAAKVGR